MVKITLNKKILVPISGIVLIAVIFIIMIGPLFGRVRKAGEEANALEREMIAARDSMKTRGKFQKTGNLITRQRVSLAIDEITRIGATLEINFLSISPQPITKTVNSKYPILLIQMDLRSEYENLGNFLGALEKLQESIVTIRSFEMNYNQKVSSKIETELVVEIHLREGEDG